jgi:hypothetical protein
MPAQTSPTFVVYDSANVFHNQDFGGSEGG